MPPASAATATVDTPKGPRFSRPRRGTIIATSTMAIAIVLVLIVPSMLTTYGLYLATTAAISGYSALSIGVVTGRAGMMSLCQLSFAGVGAWSYAYLNVHDWHLPTPLMVVIAGLAALPFGALLAIPALRVRGINLAIITLGFAGFAQAYFNDHEPPGQSTGVLVARTDWFTTDESFFIMCALMLFATIGLLAFLDRRPIGSAWLGIRHSERAVAAMGASVAWSKISSFALSAFIAGMAGGLMLAQTSVTTPDPYFVLQSLIAFAVAILVGARYPEGAIIAGISAAYVPQLFNELGISTDYGNVMFGVGMVGALISGFGIAEGWRHSFRRRELAREEAVTDEAHAQAVKDKVARVEREVTRTVVAADAPTALDISGLTVRYGSVVALDNVDVKVAEGSVHALIGPNGAGKSTLVDAVTGFISSYDGTVLLDGKRIDGLSAMRRARSGLRRTFQQGLAIPTLTVQRYLQLAAHRVIPRDEAIELMQFLEGPPPHRTIADIDVGSRRIVEVAACLAARPKVLLLDEPGAGLADEESRLLGARLAEFPGRFGCSVLLIDHDMELVQASCSAITVLDFGKVIASGPTDEVLAQTAVIDAYLGASEEASMSGA